MDNNRDTKKKNLFMRRHAYLDDFQKTVTGEYVYMGALYNLAGEKPMRKVIGNYIPFAAVIFAVIVACGCFRVAGMSNCAYVLLPYAVSIFSSALALWAIVRLAFTKEPVRHYVYKATVPRFRICSLVTLLACGVTLIGDIVYVVLNGFEGLMPATVIFMILQLICILGAVYCYLRYKKLSWNLYDPETGMESLAD